MYDTRMELGEYEALWEEWEADMTPEEREVGWYTICVVTDWKKKPRRLKPVGFWSTGAASALPHPNNMIDSAWSMKERRAVLAYLRTGRPKGRYLGFASCRCGCKEHVPGTADMTDETWVWPEGLSHYIEEHGVRLPEEFVQHVMERS